MPLLGRFVKSSAMRKRYLIVATASAHVDTWVTAESKAQALRKAAKLPPSHWRQAAAAIDPIGLEVTDTEPEKQP